MESSIRTLHVAADPGDGTDVSEYFECERDRITVRTAAPATGLDLLVGDHTDVDCIVSEYDLPGCDGIEFLDAVRETDPDLPFVLFTSNGSETVASEAVAAGVTEYLPKTGTERQYEVLGDRIERDVAAYRAQDRRERKRDTTVGLLHDLYAVTTDTELRFDEKIARLLESGCDRFDLAYGFLSRIEYDERESSANGMQRIVHSYGDHERLQEGQTCPLSKAYCRKTIETDDLLAVADAAGEGWESDPAYDVFELGSYIGGKVLVDGELYGTLCFASTDPRGEPFTDAERTLIRLMSKWASYELEHAQVTSELERQNERLEGFASVVAHDLRNPLNVASGRLELAQTECESDQLDHVAGAIERMKSLIDDVLALAREGQAVTSPEWVDPGAIAEQCWRNVATADATLRVETERSIRAEPSRLKQLFENLFRNAVEHGGSAVTITVGELDDGFAIEDDGPGIPKADRSDVFEFGYSTESDGTGYGLAIVKEIAEAHGWDIDVADGEGGGARFEIHTTR
ncbi:response regulator [Halobellus sp. Atlit-38R]|uniref:hybrid sensor histidine kinase/response regulator n=1 Tax=Halobellus sp. Atlit-38R TaxID=2282131 RepID=UPI000EF17E67|nr:ATP-binding protein [Halobellus sp. Atlit-38R]RLM88940.1 response regulator [Halobellus sp. Atlit-38R]